MGRSRRGRKPQAGIRRRKRTLPSRFDCWAYRNLAIDPLESRTLLTATLNVRFEVDAPGPVSTLSVGENFTLKVFVQDARGADATGVNQAYFNLAYSTSLASVTGPVSHGADFDVTATGDDSTPGTIKDAGGLSTTSIPPSPPTLEQLLFSVPMKATGSGQFNITPSLSNNPSDVVLFFYSSTGVPLSSMNFTGLPLTVSSGPAVSSIVTADSNPTNSTLVHYTVNFNEPVSGVDATDFGLAQAGITGSSIANVSPSSGLNSSYTVTVNAGSLTSTTGALGLNLIDGDTITDGASNTLAGGHTNNTIFTGQTYTIDRTAPSVSSIVTADSNPTNAATVHYTVTFSKAVTGVDTSDFGLAATGVSGASITGVIGSGSTYTVSANSGSGNGTLGLNFINGDVITDSAGNTLAGAHTNAVIFTGPNYTIQKTPPAVNSITLADPNPTNAGTLHYTVTFSEAVSGVDATDFTLVPSGVSGASISSVSGSGTTWTVTVNSGSGNGTLGLNFIDGDAVTDGAGNTLAGGHSGTPIFTGQTYTIQKTPPAANSIALADPTPTNAATVHFTVTFSESVTGVDASDFALTGSGLTGTSITGVSGSGASYTVAANTGSGNGTLGLNFVNGDVITDAAGNTVAGAHSGAVLLAGTSSYTIDKMPPVVSSITLADSNPTNAGTVHYTVNFSQSVTGVALSDFALAASGVTGASITNLSGSGATYTVTANSGSGDGTLGLNFVNGAVVTDAAGNTLAGANNGNLIFTGQDYTIEKSSPAVTSITPSDANPTNASTVHFAVTFNQSVTGVDISDFVLAASGISGASISSVTGSGANWTVTASTGAGNGTLGVNFVNGDLISDAAGNTVAGANTGALIFTGQTYTIQKTPPAANSIVLADPSPTNAATVHFTVTFSESVTGVDSSDFALVASGVTGTSITNVSGSGATYTVTASTGSGNGTLGVNFVNGDLISDAAGNTVAGAHTGAVILAGPTSYTINKTPPVVSSIVPGDTNPTNAATVHFTVTFSESVTGVDASDFALAATGVTGAAISNVAGSGATWTVTASTGSGNGTLGLNFVNGDMVTDAAGNTLAGAHSSAVIFTGQTYTIQKTPPAVSSITLADANPTNSSTVHYAVTFSEAVTGVDASDFALAASGVSGASISNVSGSGANWTVTASTGSGDGTLGLNFVNGDAVSDAAGNTLAGAHTSAVILTGPNYNIEKTPPAVSAITLADASPTNAASVHFTVTFTESVTGVDTSDFAVTSSGLTGASVTNVSGSGATYTVTASTGSGDGTLGLNFVNGHLITDAAGNTVAGANSGAILFSGASSYTIDKTPPAVTSILLADANPTKASAVHFTVTFSESVSGLATSDFALAATGGVTGASVTNVSGSGATYTVTASTGTGDGTLGLNFVNGAVVTDAAGNTLAGANNGSLIFGGQAYTIEKTSPVVSSIVPADANPTNATTVHYTVTFTQAVTGVDASDFALAASGVTGASITNVAGSGASWTVTANTGSGDGTLGLNFVNGDAVADAAGNTLAGANTGSLIFAGQTYTVQKTPPAVTAIGLADASPTNAATVHFTVAFTESVSGVDASDFALVASGVSGASITNVAGSGANWTVTVSTGTGNGTLGLNFIDGDAVTDAAGNTLAGGHTNNIIFSGATPYTIDKTPPVASSILATDLNPTAAATVHFSVTFSKSVSGVDSSDFALAASGVTGASISSVSGSGANWTVTVNSGSGNGTLGLNLIDGDAISDAAGNTLAGGHTGTVLFTGQTYTLDRTLPTVTSVVPADANPTNAAAVHFTVTFSESVTGVDSSDFVVVPSAGISGPSISNVSGSGATWTVTVNTGSGDGTLALNVIDGDPITDSTNKTLGGTHTGALIFAGESYTIDKTPPSTLSISPAGANPTHAATVQFTVTFSESVTGVDSTDFALVPGAGIAGATITNVAGSGATWTVTADTGSGSGTLGLSLVDGDAISDAAGNTLGGGHTGATLFTGATPYTIDKSAPSVSSITLADASPTNAATVHFTVTFDKSVTGVDGTDFALVPTGVVGAAITNVAGSGTTWTVTASTGTGDGTLGLNFVDGNAVMDAAGNTLAGGHTGATIFSGPSSYAIDKTPPAVTSIALADANPTNAATVHFAVTLSESVSGVVAGDFALAETGVSGASITNVSGSGATYTVTVSTGTGDGTLGLNFVNGPAVTDAAGNTLAGANNGGLIFTGQSYTIQKTAPSVTSIVTADPNPTNAATVHFAVTFSESVSGVDASDFALAPGGPITGPTITSVSGSGANWTVTVDTGSGNGTLGLNFVDGDAVSDAAGNTLAGGHTGAIIASVTTPYTIDKSAPAVTNISLVDASPTNAATVHFTVTFDKSVTGVDPSDFALVATGVTGAAITNVTGSGATWTVTASTGSGNGTLGLDFIDGDAVTDASGNTLAGGHTSAVIFAGAGAYTIDKTAPVVGAISLADPSPTHAATVHFTVTFSKSVSGVDATDFSLVAGGGLTGATITGVTGSGTTWSVTANTGSGNGTLGLDFVDGNAVTDAAGNTLAGGHTGATIFAGPSAYTVNKTAPTVSSIVPIDANPTNAATVHYTVTFSASVSGVDASDFSLAASGLTGAAITNVAGSGTSWTVTATTGTGNGTLGLDLIDGDAISDAAGNTLAGNHTNATLFTGTPAYTINKTPPAVNAIALADSSPTNAATVHFTVTFSESVTGVDATDFELVATGVTGAAITNVAGSGTTWTVTANTGSGNGTLGLNFVNGDTVTDAAGNTLAGANSGAVIFSGATSYAINKTPPAVSSITPSDTNPTHAATVHYAVTFSESVSGVDATDFALVQTGVSGAVITNVSGSGANWTVTATTGTGNGTLGLNLINGDAVTDGAGNTLAGARNGATIFTGATPYTVNKTAPAVSSISLVDATPTNAATVHFTVTFSENVTGVDATDFALATGAGISGATISSVTGSDTTWTVTANTGSGNGTIGLNFIDGNAVTDASGNTVAGGHTNAVIFTGTSLYTIDKTAPTVVSITPSGNNPSNGSTVQFTITFSESVTGVNTSDFSLSTGGSITGDSITGVTGSGSTWTVTINTGTGNGSITLKLIDGDAITDAAGNKLAGGHTGATIFTGQTSETIQKTPPSVLSIALADSNPVAAPKTVHFTVTFSESVTGLDASDFSLTSSGLTGSSITSVTGSGATWTVAAASGTGNGTLGLKLIDGDVITDTAGNTLAGTHTGATIFAGTSSYSVQTPVVQSISVTGIAVTVAQGTTVTNAEVATFTAVGGSQTASDFTATIDWGDGSTSAGTIAAISTGFSVTGSHVYGSPGERTMKMTVQATGGASAQGVTTATVGSADERFIAQVYRDLLHREVEPQGLQYWTGILASGASREQTVKYIEYSIEYRDDVVQGLYQLYLHRAADPTLPGFANMLISGTPEQVAEALVSSPEYFQNRGGSTNTGFLNALFNDALNRNADSGALQATASLDLTKVANRTMLAQAVFGGGEYLNDLVSYPGGTGNTFHADLPFGFYQAYLARNAESTAIAFYAGELKAGTLDSAVVAHILGTDEYLARADAQPG